MPPKFASLRTSNPRPAVCIKLRSGDRALKKLAFMNNTSLTAEQINRQTNLLNQLINVESFECEGTIFKGNREVAVKSFMFNNPHPADFYVWLRDHYEVLKY